jgi:purine-binding chemotaxis protein CheW
MNTVDNGALLVTTFYLRGALFGLDASLVEEVVRLRHTTPVPNAPGYILGVMNLRGKIVSVIDLPRKLGLAGEGSMDDSRVYIVRDRSELLGLLVDRAADVVELDRESLEPAPANVPGSEAGFLLGIGRTAGGLTAVLNPAAVLAGEA